MERDWIEEVRKLCGEAFDWIDEQLCWEGQDGEHPEDCRECGKKKELLHRLYKAWKTGSVGDVVPCVPLTPELAERIAEAVLRDREQAVVRVTAGYTAGSDKLGKHYETRDVTWLPTVAGLTAIILRVRDSASGGAGEGESEHVE